MSKFVGTGPSSYEKRIYRAAVSQRLRNTGIRCVTSVANLFWLVDPCYICGCTMSSAIIYSHSSVCTVSHLMHF
jgi:hypothetical protein